MILAFVFYLSILFLDLIFGSFLLDPFLLIISGIVIVWISEKFLKKKFVFLISFLTLLIFYIGSVSLYLNLPYVNFLYEIASLFPLIKKSPSGFNFMINSGVFNIPYNKPEEAPFYLHLISGVIFATYPLYLYLGIKFGNKLFK
jgi:hypothetical protein